MQIIIDITALILLNTALFLIKQGRKVNLERIKLLFQTWKPLAGTHAN
jgi:hypothetical protein